MWLILASTSYLFTAVTNLADKFLLAKYLKEAVIYAFYIGVLGGVVIVIAPFGVSMISLEYMAYALLSGLTFILALYLMFSALLHGEATRVATVIGGSQPIFVLALAVIFLGERLFASQITAFSLLIIGLFLIAYQKGITASRKIFILAVASGLSFAISYVTAKFLYDELGFLDGFFWTRLAATLCALMLLLYPRWRKSILGDKNDSSEVKKSRILVVGVQILGAIGFILLHLSISLGSVTLINAMQGVQYAIIFILSLLLSKKFPEIKELSSPAIIFRKITAIFFIAGGLAILAYYV